MSEIGDKLPCEIRVPMGRLRDGLVAAVGDDLVALAVYGSAGGGGRAGVM